MLHVKVTRVARLLVFFLLPLLANAQDTGLINRLTTPIEVRFRDGGVSSGSGFFFQVFAPPEDPTKTGPQWRAILKVFLLTNRHVVQPERFNQIDKLVFHLRRQTQTGTEWAPVELSQQELGKRLHLHPNPQVDVAAIDVLDLISELVKGDAANHAQPTLQAWFAVSRENFPGVSKLEISSGDDVIVVGYPRLFYDEYNKLPILKLGMLVTPWGMRYRNQDAFLIDYRGFHGSSGSVVISKPTNILIQKGQLYTSQDRQFLFLGVYSGEPIRPGPVKETDEAIIQEKLRVDLGQVWYYYTVEDAIAAPSYR
jgi:hypothetical protein